MIEMYQIRRHLTREKTLREIAFQGKLIIKEISAPLWSHRRLRHYFTNRPKTMLETLQQMPKSKVPVAEHVRLGLKWHIWLC